MNQVPTRRFTRVNTPALHEKMEADISETETKLVLLTLCDQAQYPSLLSCIFMGLLPALNISDLRYWPPRSTTNLCFVSLPLTGSNSHLQQCYRDFKGVPCGSVIMKTLSNPLTALDLRRKKIIKRGIDKPTTQITHLHFPFLPSHVELCCSSILCNRFLVSLYRRNSH